MTDFEINRRNFLKFATALGVAAAVPVTAIEAVAPVVAEAEKFVGPRLEVFMDRDWIQIPGLNSIEQIETLEVVEAHVQFRRDDEPYPVVTRTFNSHQGYALEGVMPCHAIEAVQVSICTAAAAPAPMRIVWNGMLIEFDGYVTKLDMGSFTTEGPRWAMNLVTTTQPRIRHGLA